MPETEASTAMPPLEPGPIGSFIGTTLAEENRTSGGRATFDGTLMRGSNARGCARKLGFDAIGYPADVETEETSLLAFRAGHIWHDQIIQPALVECFGAELEVGATWMPNLSLSCFLDATYEPPNIKVAVPNRAMRRALRFKRVAVEIKSMATFGFELATGVRTKLGEPAGPKPEHVCQSALGALAPGVMADGMHLIYCSKERGSLAEWIFGVDEPLPHLGGVTPADLARDELRRMAGIIGRLEAGLLPRPVIPGVGLVTSPPARGSRGTPWNCRYCPYQPTCESIGPDVVPLSSLPAWTEAMTTTNGNGDDL